MLAYTRTANLLSRRQKSDVKPSDQERKRRAAPDVLRPTRLPRVERPSAPRAPRAPRPPALRPRALPPTANHKPGAKRVSTRRGVSWGLVFGVSTLTFTLASALAYAVVSIAQRAS